MNRSFIFGVLFLTAFGMFLGMRPVQAGYDCPVYCSAERYREAVREFERHVQRVRYVARCDERLVDDLEDSTSRLRTAARQLNRLDRLCQRFAETDFLHQQVEGVFFGSGVYPPDPRLDACWLNVARTYQALAFEMNQLPCYRAFVTQNRGSCSTNLRTYRSPIRTSSSFNRGSVISIPRPSEVPFGVQIDPTGLRPTVGVSSFDLRGQYSNPRVIQQALPPAQSLPTPPTRRSIQDFDQLRSAVIGAMLQRR